MTENPSFKKLLNLIWQDDEYYLRDKTPEQILDFLEDNLNLIEDIFIYWWKNESPELKNTIPDYRFNYYRSDYVYTNLKDLLEISEQMDYISDRFNCLGRIGWMHKVACDWKRFKEEKEEIIK